MSLKDFKPSFPVEGPLKVIFDTQDFFMSGYQNMQAIITTAPKLIAEHPETANFVFLRLAELSCGCLFAKALSDNYELYEGAAALADHFYVTYLEAKLCKFRHFPGVDHTLLDYLQKSSQHLRIAAQYLLSPANLALVCGVEERDLLNGAEIKRFDVANAIFDNITALKRDYLDIQNLDALYCNFLLIYVTAEQSAALQAYFCANYMVSLLNLFLNRNEVYQNQRVLRALVRALLALCNEDGQQQMVGFDVHITLQQLLSTSLDDLVKALVEELLKSLEGKINQMSTIECYREQLNSRIMQMTPMHISAVFWKQNVQHFVENQYGMLKQLVSVGADALKAEDYQTVKTALNDFGQFAIFHPRGKLILYKIPEVRDFVVSTYGVEDEEIVQLAVGCLAKLMVVDWDSV